MDDLDPVFSELAYGGVIGSGVGNNSCHFGQAHYGVRRRRPQLLLTGEDISVGRPAHQDALHGRLIDVPRGKALLRVYASDTEEVEVSRNSAGCLGRGCTADRGRTLEQPATQYEHIYGRVAHQSRGDRGAVGNYGGGQVGV